MSILNVNQIQPVGSGQTVTISATNVDAGSATVTAGTFSGNLSSSGISTFSDTVNVGAGKSIRLYGATSGYSEIIAAAGSASTTFTLPANGGSASQYLQTDGAGALSWQTVSTSNLTRGTAVTPTAQSTIDFTGIESDVRRITLILDDLTFSTSGNIQFRLGTSGGFVSSGYNFVSGYIYYNSVADSAHYTTSFQERAGFFTRPTSGRVCFENITGNLWSCAMNLGGDYTAAGAGNGVFVGGGGSVDLGGTLTQVRILNTGGNNFTAGTVNILTEV